MVKQIAFMAMAMAIAAPAHAQDARVDPDHIMTVLKDAGFPAEYFNDDDDYRQILTKTGNYQFLVEMYDCVDSKECQTLEFYSNFPMETAPTKEKLDAFPGPREGARIFLRRGEAVVQQELDINGEGGLSDEQFIARVKTWEALVASFTTYLRQPAEASAAATPAPAASPASS